MRMTEHTTIQITKAQADELQGRKTHDDESYKSVIARLLDGDSSAIESDELAAQIVDQIGATAGGPQVDDSEIAREVARQLDYTAIADKVSRQVVSELQQYE